MQSGADRAVEERVCLLLSCVGNPLKVTATFSSQRQSEFSLVNKDGWPVFQEGISRNGTHSHSEGNMFGRMG